MAMSLQGLSSINGVYIALILISTLTIISADWQTCEPPIDNTKIPVTPIVNTSFKLIDLRDDLDKLSLEDRLECLKRWLTQNQDEETAFLLALPVEGMRVLIYTPRYCHSPRQLDYIDAYKSVCPEGTEYACLKDNSAGRLLQFCFPSHYATDRNDNEWYQVEYDLRNPEVVRVKKQYAVDGYIAKRSLGITFVYRDVSMCLSQELPGKAYCNVLRGFCGAGYFTVHNRYGYNCLYTEPACRNDKERLINCECAEKCSEDEIRTETNECISVTATGKHDATQQIQPQEVASTDKPSADQTISTDTEQLPPKEDSGIGKQNEGQTDNADGGGGLSRKDLMLVIGIGAIAVAAVVGGYFLYKKDQKDKKDKKDQKDKRDKELEERNTVIHGDVHQYNEGCTVIQHGASDDSQSDQVTPDDTSETQLMKC